MDLTSASSFRPLTRQAFVRYCRTVKIDPAMTLSHVGQWALGHFQKSQNPQFLESAVGFTRAALLVCPPDHAAHVRLTTVLAGFLYMLYSISKDLDSLRECVRLYDDAETRSHRDLDQLFQRTGQSTHGAIARSAGVDGTESAATTIYRPQAIHCQALLSLSSDLDDSFRRSGCLSDLDGTIAALEHAVDLYAAGDPARIEAVVTLARRLRERCLRCGSAEDLSNAIRLHSEALEACPKDDGRMLWISLMELASDLRCRFDSQGTQMDLDECIALRRRALRTKSSSEMHCHGVSIIADDLQERFQQFGILADLDEALHLLRHCESLLSPTHAGHTNTLDTLADVLGSRFRHLRSQDDFEECMELRRRALRLRKSDDPERCMTLVGLAAALRWNGELMGRADDNEEAICLLREARALSTRKPESRPTILNNLAVVLEQRFTREEKLGDLDEAIALSRGVLALRGPGHPRRPDSLSNLGVMLGRRFDYAGDLRDIHEAVQLQRESLDLRLPDTPSCVGSLHTLANSLCRRFDRLGDVEDAREARALREEGLRYSGPAQLDRERFLFGLAELFMNRRVPYFDLHVALQYLLEAIRGSDLSAYHRMMNAVRVAEQVQSLHAHLDDRSRAEYLHVLTAIVELLPKVATFAFHIVERLKILRSAESISAEAASHALTLSQTRSAIEVLEAGRALFWTQSLSLRPPLDHLPRALRDEFGAFAHQLEADSWEVGLHVRTVPPETQMLETKGMLEWDLARRRRQNEAFDALISRIRATAGCERFLCPDEFDVLIRVADKGPVVVLVASYVSCDAIVLTAPGHAQRVPLPMVSVTLLQQLCARLKMSNGSNRDGRLEARMLLKKQGGHPSANKVLKTLWDTVVKVVIDALMLRPCSGRNRPRLWWCPTGPFAFLPIHAAGIFSSGGECCSDYVVSSYTPTLAALLNARRSHKIIARKDAKTLLVAVSRPFRGCSLPATVAEIRIVKEAIPPELVTTLSGEGGDSVRATSDATVNTLLDKLPEATILHLASHGWQHPSNPLESGFVMSDDMLTISKLMPLPLPRAFLAFLSACETAKGDQEQPDQTVHLAATMLFAGFKSVVATMWSMYDVDGPEVARTVYEQLFGGDAECLDPEEVPYALDSAVRVLRDRGLHPSRWAPYIHLGL